LKVWKLVDEFVKGIKFLGLALALAVTISSAASAPALPPQADGKAERMVSDSRRDASGSGDRDFSSMAFGVSANSPENNLKENFGLGSLMSGMSESRPVKEVVSSDNSVLSAYGTDFQLLGKGHTPTRIEARYRFKDGNSQSIVAIDRHVESVKFYTIKEKKAKKAKKGGRTSTLEERKPISAVKKTGYYGSLIDDDGDLSNLFVDQVLSQVPQKNRDGLNNFLNLDGRVIPDRDVNLYQVNHKPDEWVYLNVVSKEPFSVMAADPAGAYATYDSGFSAPYCPSGDSPCVANSSLLLSRDGMGPGEPNAPNTIDAASDGTTATTGYQDDESVENITVRSLDHSVIGAGDQVEVTAWYYCYGTSDVINFVYTGNTSTINWAVQNSNACQGSPGPFSRTATFTLDNSDGNQAVRVLNEYNGVSTATAATSQYGDNDDLVFNVDGEAPSLSLYDPSNESIFQSGELVKFNSSDPENHFDSMTYSLDGGAEQSLPEPFEIDTSSWSEGVHTLDVTVNDTAGNQRTKTYQFTVDDTKPYVEILNPVNKLYSTESLTLDYSSTDTHLDQTFYSLNNNENKTLSGSTSFTAPDGVNTIRLYANDIAGNLNQTNVDFEVDTTPPGITLDSPRNDSDIEEGLYLNFTISDPNLDDVSYTRNGSDNKTDFVNSYDIGTRGWTDGINNLTVYANDTVGYSNSKYYEFNVTANQPPVIILDEPANTTPIKGQDIINLTVSDSSLDTVKYSIDDAPNSTNFVGSYDIPLDISSEGNFTVDVYANDTEGESNFNFYKFEVDNTKPEITVYSPENTTYTSSNVDLNYSSSDKNLNKTYYNLNGGSNTTLNGNISISIQEGTNTLNIYSEDDAENIRSKKVVFSKDTTGPEISIVNPENITYFQRDVPAEVSLNEEGQKCVYSLDGGSNVTMGQENITRFSNTLSDLNYGQHDIKFWCKDPYGNWGNTSTRYFSNEEPGAAYSSNFGAPFCQGGKSPCNVGENLIISVDNIATNEPNSPNTIDGASDGTTGTYQNDESVDEINITDNTAPSFGSGHSLTVSTLVYCWGTSDVINFIYTDSISSPGWTVKDSQSCGGAGFEDHTATFSITGTGNVSIRVLNEYNGDASTIQQSSGYGDQDDVVLPLDNFAPEIVLDSPTNESIIVNGTQINLDVSDPKYNRLSTAQFSNDSGTNYTLPNPYNIDTTGWQGGTQQVKVYANDTAANYASKTYEFTVDKTPPTGTDLNEKKGGAQVSRVFIGNSYNFTASWTDNYELANAKIASNETGSFQNGSLTGEVALNGANDYSNFSFTFPSTSADLLGWKVWGQDKAALWNDTYTETIEVWRYVNVTWKDPVNGEVPQGDTVNFQCKVKENLTTSDVNGYTVNFHVNDSTTSYSLGSDETDINGNAYLDWDTSGYAIGNYTSRCNITEDTSQQYEPLRQEDSSSIYVGEGDAKVNQVEFTDSDPVGGENVNISVNVSNHGLKDINSMNLSLKTESFNGTDWRNNGTLWKTVDIPVNDWKKINLTWKVKPGPWRFNATADPQDNLEERNESDNYNSTEVNISSYHTFYGGSDISVELASNDGYRITYWGEETNNNSLYFSDADVTYSVRELLPLNVTGDLSEADDVLALNGHNDSVNELFSQSRTRCFDVAGEPLCDVPYVNSTITDSFQTGILYDASDGAGFTGIEPLVFITNVNKSKSGKYGTYDYEAKIPATLGLQEPSVDKIQVFTEIG
jgi:hypothetical protein